MGVLLNSATAPQDAGGGMLVMILVYVAFFAVLWLLFMRPQKKEQKRVSAMLADLANGDCVLTTSGFYGVVIDISDDTVIVEFGNNKNCRIPMKKTAIVEVEKPEMQ